MPRTSLAELAAWIDAPSDGAGEAASHPHRPAASVPVALPAATVRALSRVSTARSALAIATEWAIIAAAIAVAVVARRGYVTALAVVVIGARQHALAVLAHDGAHFRLFKSRRANDWLGDLLVGWPAFVPVRLFRVPHGPHHRFLGEPDDGNRRAWRTHDDAGNLRREWRYPKTRLALALVLARRAALVTGVFFMLRSLVGMFLVRRPPLEIAARLVYYGAIVGGLVATGHGRDLVVFWFLPLCTWHMLAQYVRLICEHSGRIATHPDFALTRSTLPGPVGRFFILPRNIGYHLEHHWYPSVPLHRLPELHDELRKHALFVEHANVSRSVLASLRQCVEETTA